ncbi:uncharacterized protein MYCFIDRAFT_171677 [Pseudocercospora fijiensis CIRAD86]|uniref:Uncharacterized protein n=1 Tax=Pseudocercospora fijiensis (strain CIRAD86) TaxID=383855 RepID=M2Z7S7_PSEFD|nr:uncharacterized protein MYCFIDRAFT_171677 [Pseudocercospora fijiensis CIRAD86]EME85805.1 hypothetical protein MYCFIDRAFT_171677 [Pseudocercospora fijiensis CIRAD86]
MFRAIWTRQTGPKSGKHTLKEKLSALPAQCCEDSTLNITIRLYRSLISDGDWEVVQPVHQNYRVLHEVEKRSRETIETLYTEWAVAVREAELPNCSQGTYEPATRFCLDVRRPADDEEFRFASEMEHRGLHRITALLRHRFKAFGSLEAVLINAACWCILAEAEKQVALPRGQSWPRLRQSCAQENIDWQRANWRNPEMQNAVFGGGDAPTYEQRLTMDFDPNAVHQRASCRALGRRALEGHIIRGGVLMAYLVGYVSQSTELVDVAAALRRSDHRNRRSDYRAEAWSN